MNRRIAYLVILLFWLVPEFGSAVLPETIAAPAPVEGEGASQTLVVSGEVAPSHLPDPQVGSDPVSLQAQAGAQPLSPDRDYDGLTDSVETTGWWNAAGFFTTEPLDPDSDDDGLTDGQEKLFDTDPLADTSPGIYVEYSSDLKTSKYFTWERYGDKFIALHSAVVRRGTTFYVGGPADATIEIEETGSLTNLTPRRDVCMGRWRITVPSGGTVGKYTITLEKGTWSKSLKLYVIFELPTNMSSADVAAYVYSDDPDNFRDEYAIWFMTTFDADYSWSSWPPYHLTYGRAFAFRTDHYLEYVFEDHIINTINGYTSQSSAASALAYHTDQVMRFESNTVRLDMYSALHSYNQYAQCSTQAAAMTSFARGAGIPSRPVMQDWNMDLHNALFDHSAELWLYSTWRVVRTFRHNESPPPTPIAGGIYGPRSRSNWFYHHPDGDIIAVADSDWVWEQTQTDWGGSEQRDYCFANFNTGEIVRWDWVDTEAVPYYGWGREPTDIGDPYSAGFYWPSVPTPSLIVQIEGNGTVTKNPNLSYYSYDDHVTLEAFPAVGWSFTGWSGDLTSTDNPEVFVITEAEDAHVTATFTQDEYGLTISTSGSGSVDKDPDQPTYHYGDVVTLDPDPATGWFFDTWSGPDAGELSDNGNGTWDLLIDGPKQVTANFDQYEYTLTVNPGSGSVVKDPNQSTYHYGDVVELTAHPEPSFDHWSGDLSGSENPEYLTMPNRNASVTAHFTGTQEAGLGSKPLAASNLESNSPGGGHAKAALVPFSTPTPTPGPVGTPAPAAANRSTLAPVSLNTGAVPYLPAVLREMPDKIVRIGQVVADYGVDLDGNGRFDQLVIEVEVSTAQPGYYSIGGFIGSPEFASLMEIPVFASAVTNTYLEAGSQTVQLTVDGTFIALAQVDGPYEVIGLWVSDLGLDSDPVALATQTLDRKVPTYVTAAYKVSDFETLGATLTDQYTERGVDGDRDGRYESLTIDVGLDISTPGTYIVVGDLYDHQGQLISQSVWTGSQSPASLQFGEVAGTVGPYTLEKLYLLNANDEIIDSRAQAYTTQRVVEAEGRTRIVDQPVDQVIPGEIVLQGILPDVYSDAGLDLDGDGLYDLLAIDVQVEVEEGEAGPHRLEGWLAKDGSLISWAESEPIDLAVGTHVLSLRFSGPAIRAHNTDGPFTLAALRLLAGEGYAVLDEVDVAYTTSAYTSDQFESLPYLELAADQVVLFEDRVEDGEGAWSDDWPWDIVTAQSHSPTHSWTDSPGENYGNYRDVSLTTGSIALPAFSRAVLHFQTCYELEADYDYGYVETSTDGGATWAQAATYTDRTVHWSGETVDLGVPDDAGTLRVRFRLDTDSGTTADGWYIDDVVVYFDNDLDDDGISNGVEVGGDPGNPVDTDGDGTPDYQDLDSDADGIPDAAEAGDDLDDPVDTDGDGTPDYRDLDSDGDGIPDSEEGAGDTDGDGTPDFQDTDSDGDGIPDDVEAGDDPANPVDTDGDGTPDYQDDDSDGDGIPDDVEAGEDPTDPVDTDGDGIPDYQDPDSDGDGLPDSEEGGGDTDGDGIPDFQDLDSDNDGLPDAVDPEPNVLHYFIHLPMAFR
jgi:uncharacterized repeat protein (TIGR02543 family)